MSAVLLLARAALRSRWRAALLIALVFATVAASAATGLAARSALTEPWDQLFADTDGAHVRITAPTRTEADAIAASFGTAVTTDATRRFGFQRLRTDDGTYVIGVLVAEEAPVLDRPVVLAGDDAGLWIEHSYAAALGLSAGAVIEVERADGTWATTHVGAIVAAVVGPPYPARFPGIGMIDAVEADALGLPAPVAVSVGLQLADPAAATNVGLPTGPGSGVEISTWQDVRTAATADGRAYQAILDAFSLLLVLAAAALVAVTITGQVAVDRPLHALLQAAGSTPAQTASSAALEHGVAAAVGATFGVIAARAASGPVLDAVGPDLGIAAPGVRVGGGVAVVTVLVAVAMVISWVAARHAARRVALLGRDVGAGEVRSRPLSSRLPVAPALGRKDAFSGRARSLMAAAVVALAVVAGVAALSMEATFANQVAAEAGNTVSLPPPLPGLPGGDLPERPSDEERLRPLVYGLELLLTLVAGATVFLATSLDTRERRAESASLLAAGVTPGQLTLARATTTGIHATLGTAVGVPLGVGFFLSAYAVSNGSIDDAAIAGPAALMLGALVALAAVTSLAALAATFAARSTPIAAALRQE